MNPHGIIFAPHVRCHRQTLFVCTHDGYALPGQRFAVLVAISSGKRPVACAIFGIN